MYAFKTGDYEKKTAKGINKNVKDKVIKFEDF